MKIIKHIALALTVILSALACEKHEIIYRGGSSTDGKAMFQIFYVEPVSNTTSNYIDSVYVNGVLVNGNHQLYVFNVLPAGNKFYTIDPGVINLKFFRGHADDGSSRLIYERDVTLKVGRCQVMLYDLNEDPIILDDQYPYIAHTETGDGETFNTDSVTSIRLINFAYASPGVPYPDKVQYQYLAEGSWRNLGEPIGFGEQTTRTTLSVHKSTFNSSGEQRFDFRCIVPGSEETGSPQVINYTTDWWRCYIGMAYTHILRGDLSVRTTHYSCFASIY